ncbi:hypothetical protein NDU88_001715 [Pleurodeles waltl]|uniref:Uncharacterized protein n=1 Tax=Pleurodeles waltl TaxID=8319 RepID=A0AAV7KTK3_PLEWA|nr:hypothetical protein NDU88_001715 [Pleurodeles waltl]
MGAVFVDEHALFKQRIMRGGAKQALLPSETTHECGEVSLEERTLGEASKMAPSIDSHRDTIIILSDGEDDGRMAEKGPIQKIQLSEHLFMVQEGRMLQESIGKAVRSDRRDEERKKTVVAVHLPRGQSLLCDSSQSSDRDSVISKYE